MINKPISRFTRYIEVFSWLLVLTIFLLINLLPLEEFQDFRFSLNVATFLNGLQILVYHHLLSSKQRDNKGVNGLYQFLAISYVFFVIHLTGFLGSIFFVLLFIPILISAFTLTPLRLLIVVFYICLALFLDAFVFFPTYFQSTNTILLLGERIGSIAIVGFLSYLFDYEVRRREKEAQRAESERVYATHLAEEMNFLNKQSRAILDSISEVVLGIDSRGKVIFYNRYAEKLLGWMELEAAGKNYTNFLLLYPSGESYIINDLKKPLEKDLSLFKKEGQMISVRLINSPIVNDDNQFLGNVLTIRDISKEKELEEMKFDFVSMAAHELRSPVTIIRGYLNAINEEVARTDPKIQRYIRRAMITTDSLRVLIENLLNISQIEKGVLKINQEKIVWEDLVEKIIGDFDPRAEEKNIKIIFKKPKGKLPPVLVDIFRISEVLANLLNNALSYTDQDGLIAITISEKNNFLVTEVNDTGIGIAEKSIPYLFQKFYRVNENIQSGQGGTGLGLYISKAIVQRHGGRIWLKSKVGKGSSFYFTVPTVLEEKESAQEEKVATAVG